MKRAAIYCRISQDREGRALGVERQEEDCRALADRLGYTVVGVYSDNDLSASTRSRKARPQYRRMVADAQAGHLDVILAYTSGRITRKPRENEDLIELAEQHGVRFEYVSSPSFDLNTSAGRRIARIMAATDAGEAEDTQERIVRQRQQAASRGAWPGGRRPYGYEADGVTVRLDEAAEIRRASQEVLNGASVRSLARDMNSRGMLTTTGIAWDSMSLKRVLIRPRNAGLREYRGEIIGKAAWPGVVAESLWRRVHAVLTDPARRTSPGNAVKWMGSGLYRCECGQTVRATVTGNPRRRYYSYSCGEGKHVARVALPLDALVSAVVVERLSRPDAVDLLAADIGEDPAEAIEQASLLREELDELAAAHGRDELTLSQLTTASAFKRKRLEKLDQQIAAMGRVSVLNGLVGAEDVGAAWEALDIDRKRAVIDRLFTVELWKAQRGRRKGWRPGESYLDPATVKFHPKP